MSYYNPEQAAQLRDIGHYLQQQRLSQSLTLEDIAEETFIRLAVLRSLENGDVDQLPERVYVQGFIRRYADLLGINGEELVKTLSEIPDTLPPSVSPVYPPQKEQQVSTFSPTQRQSPTSTLPPPPSKPVKSEFVKPSSAGIGRYWPFLVLLALLSGIAGYFFTRRPVTEPVTQETVSPVVEVSPSPIIAPEVTLSPSPSPVVKPKPDVPLSLDVQITERSWLKVTTDGQKAFEGILMPGSQQKWTAKQEITLQTGNAGGVKASVNEDPLEPLGKSGEVKTANFKAETLE